MAVRKVIRMGHPTLRKRAIEVSKEEIQSLEFKNLLTDLYDTMKAEGGIGIAAPQIDVSKMVTIIELPNQSRYGSMQGTPLLTIINPKIEYLTEELQGFWEGCLSVPGLRGFVERPKSVKINYLDEMAQEKEIIVDDFLATVFQHELDHLFGKLYIDRISDTTKISYNEEFTAYISAPAAQTLDD